MNELGLALRECVRYSGGLPTTNYGANERIKARRCGDVCVIQTVNVVGVLAMQVATVNARICKSRYLNSFIR